MVALVSFALVTTLDPTLSQHLQDIISTMPQYKRGQTVRYKPLTSYVFSFPLGPESNTSESTGKITDVLTEPGVQAERNVQASAEDPRYEIQNDNTGKMTTVYEKNILGSA
ncbi:hypothetical protein AAE478_003722 [Parahypoxylon ruwenzoriense]